MDIVKIVVLAIVGGFLSVALKEYNAFLGIAISITTVVMILFFVFPEIEHIIEFARSIYRTAGGKDMYIDSMLKIAGIACLTRLGSDILKDAGMTAASSAITMTGRIVCTGLCIPIVNVLFDTLLTIIPM